MKKLLQMLLPLVAIMALAMPVRAQDVSSYTLATGTDATKWVTLSTSATAVTSIYDDDEASSLMNIGFTFTFAGANYTQWSCNSNGRIALGSTPVDEWWVNPFTPSYITNSRVVFPLIAAFGMDNTLEGSGVWCKYEVVGDAPSRMLVIEYRTPSVYNVDGDLVNYQIQFEEGTNVVRFVYGTTNATDFGDFQVGMASGTDDVITISSTHTLLTGATTTTLDEWPGVNRYYEFTPPTSFCSRVASASITAMGPDFITLSWVDNNSSSWLVRIDTQNATGTDEVATDTFYTFSNLTSQTQYIVNVAALCDGGDTSAWRSITTTTPCLFLDSIPYVYGFEGASTGGSSNSTFAAPCWNRITGSSSSYYPYISSTSTYCHTGSRGLYWYGSSSYDHTIVLPGVDVAEFPINTLQLKFWAKTNSASYIAPLQIGVMTDPNDISTFQQVATVNVEGTTWTEYEAFLSPYTGTGNFVAVRSHNPSSYWYAYFDDFTLDLMPACPHVAEVVVDSATTDGLFVSWTPAGSESSWLVYLNDSLFDVASATSYTFSDLDPNTVYTVGVRALCDNGDTADVVTATGRTLAGEPISEFPYSCGFEITDDGNQASDWVLENGTQANPWCVGTAANNGGTRSLYISNDNGSSNAYNNGTTSYTFAYATFNFEAGEYSYSYDWRAYGESSYDFIRAAVVPNTVEFTAGSYSGFNNTSGVPTGGQAIDGAYRLNLQSSWQTQTGSFTIPTDGLYKVVFMWRNDGSGGSQPPAAIDNISISLNTCPAPVALTVDSVMPNQIDVHWSPIGTENEWAVTVGNNLFTGITDTTYSITGLEEYTQYTISVRAVCGDEDTSLFSPSVTARTTVSCPWPTNFAVNVQGDTADFSWTDNDGSNWDLAYVTTGMTPTDYDIIPVTTTTYQATDLAMGFYDAYVRTNCGGDDVSLWIGPINFSVGITVMNMATSGTDTLHTCFATIYDDGGPSGSYSANCNSTLTVYPGEADNLLLVSGQSYTESTYDYLRIYAGVGTSGEVLFDDYGVSATQTFGPFYIDGPITITFHSDGSVFYSGFEVNVSCVAAPECSRPETFNLLTLLADSAEFSWTDNTNTSWGIEYGPAGFTRGNEGDTNIHWANFSDTTGWIENLVPGTNYDFYLVALCNDTSFARQITAQTPCVAIPDTAMPYHYGFEDATTGTTGSINPCWRKFNVGNSTQYPYASSSYAAEGTKSLYLYGYSSNYYSYAVMPMFETPLNTLMVDFKLYKTSSAYGSIEVGVMTNPSDISTFQTIGIYQPEAVSTWESFRVNLGTYTGTGRFIAFLQRSTYSTYLDDITVSVRPSCPNPVNVSLVAASASSAYVAWDYASGYETAPDSYRLTLTGTAGTPTVVNNVAATNYVFTGLTPNSAYTLTVESECDESYSEAATLAFRTRNLPCIVYDTTIDSLVFSTGTTQTSGIPVYSGWGNTVCQSIWTADELTEMGVSAGIITGVKLGFTANTTYAKEFSMYMGTTTASTFTSASNMIPITNHTQVYAPASHSYSTSGWHSYDFGANNFVWDGTSNIVITFFMNQPSGTPQTASSFYGYSTMTNANRSAYRYRDSSPFTPTGFTSEGSSGSASSYRPSITFFTYGCSQTSNCAAPLVAANNVQPTSVDLIWAAGNTETSWNVDHKATGDASWTVDQTNTTATTFSYTGLQASTDYMFRVWHVCGTDTFATVINVTTPCLPATVPFSENFASWTASTTAPTPACWYKTNNYSTSTLYPYVSTSYSMSAGKSMYMYSTNSSYSYLVLPKMDAPIDTLNLSFYLFKSNTSYAHALNVGVMTDPTDLSTFHQMGTATPSQFMEWEGFEFSFRNANMPDGYIAIVSPNGVYSYPYLDNIEVNYYNSCVRPTNVSDSANTMTSAVIYWTDTVTTDFTVEYGPHGFALGTGTQLTATTNSIAITGLSHSTYYDVYVRGNCGGDNSLWSFVHTFATECSAIDALPYTEDFNNWGTGSYVHVPYCWTYGSDYSSTYPYISGSYNNYGANGGSMYMYNYDYNHVGNLTWFALPMLDSTLASVNQTEVVFSTFTSTSSYVHNVMVGVNTTPNANGAVWVDTVRAVYNEWNEYEVPFDSYTGNGKYIIFATYVDSAYSTSYPYIDDLTLEMIPTCRRPDSLTVANSTTTTVDFGWNDRSSATSWVIEYGPRGFQLGTGTQVVANSNPFTVTGLPVAYQGEYYVKAVCGAGDTSDFSRRPCAFETTQIPATLPYNYDFENVAEWQNWQTTSCHETNTWYRGTSVADSGSYSMYIATGDTASYFNYAFNAVVNAAAYRDIDFGPVDSSYTLSFRARAGGCTDGRYDALMVFLVDPSIPTVTSAENLISPWGSVNDLYRIAMVYLDTTWQTYEASFDTISGVHRVAFFWFNQNTDANNHPNIPQPAAVDNIHIKYSSCPRPVSLSAIVSEGGVAYLSWQGASNANYEITYRAIGDTVNHTLVATTNSYNLTGLQAPANYVYWVRKLCGAGDTSLYSDGYQFTTPCASVNAFPWVESFENEAVFDCWAQDGPGTWQWGTGDYSTSTGAADGTHNIHIQHSTSGNVTKIISPVLQLNGTDATLIFQHIQREWAGDQDELNVYYRTDQTSQWVLLANYPDQISTWTTDTITLPNTTSTYQIAFEMVDGYGYGVAIDSVVVIGQAGAACADPVVNMAATVVGENGITLSFSGEAMQYEIGYVEGDTWTVPATTLNIADTFYTFNGLTAETQYTFGVRALCSASNMSAWTTVTLTTEAHPCFTPTGVSAINVNYNGATIFWTEGENETEWEVNINSTSPVFDTTISVQGTPQVVVTGLMDNVDYAVTVRAVCAPGRLSEPSVPYTLHTSTCDAPTNLQKSEVTSNSAVISWQGAANHYQIEYGMTGFNQGEGTMIEVENTTANLTTTYELTGLAPQSPYDVYVRSICADGVNSTWSPVLQFTTTQVGIDDVNANANISLYPNPASHMVTISGIEGTATVTVIDLNGRQIGQWRVENGEQTIDVSTMAKGAYFVRIAGESTVAVRKLVVK